MRGQLSEHESNRCVLRVRSEARLVGVALAGRPDWRAGVYPHEGRGEGANQLLEEKAPTGTDPLTWGRAD